MQTVEVSDIELGNKYRDKVSGWEGIATGRYLFLNGCERICLDGLDKDGKPDGYTFDHQQLEPVPAPSVAPPKAKRTGGPQSNAPVRQRD